SAVPLVEVLSSRMHFAEGALSRAPFVLARLAVVGAGRELAPPGHETLAAGQVRGPAPPTAALARASWFGVRLGREVGAPGAWDAGAGDLDEDVGAGRAGGALGDHARLLRERVPLPAVAGRAGG